MQLFELLKQKFPDSSTSTLRSWLAKGRILVDDVPCTNGKQAVAADVKIALGKELKYLGLGVEILYEDKDLVVLIKPDHLLSVAAPDLSLPSVHALLKRRFHRPRVYPVHRLDREASGLLVFAYSERARDGLQKQFAAHTILRQYVALVHGQLSKSEGRWESYLAENESLSVYLTTPEKGQRAITHYRRLQGNSQYTLLEITLETGKKHQIRVHCAQAGYPLVGDPRYGRKKSPIERMGLHAMKLGFVHPVSAKAISFESKIPLEFYRVF